MAQARDTSMGGGDGRFPKTTYQILQGLHGGPESRGRALERLCRRYWKAVYAYARRAWAKSNEDAKDLAQAFFLWALQDERLAHYDASRGAFRGYLKMLLRGFIADREDALRALKRGGGVRLIPMDAAPEPAAASDPNEAFDNHWKLELVSRALKRVQRHFTGPGRDIQFKAFREYAEAEKEGRPTYAEVGRRLGLAESDVRNYLHSVRARLKLELKAELADTVSGPAEFDEEWAALFGRG